MRNKSILTKPEEHIAGELEKVKAFDKLGKIVADKLYSDRKEAYNKIKNGIGGNVLHPINQKTAENEQTIS